MDERCNTLSQIGVSISTIVEVRVGFTFHLDTLNRGYGSRFVVGVIRQS
jgi:hypothetical protein